MIFLGSSGAGDNIRSLSAMVSLSKKLTSPQIFELAWRKNHFETLPFQDQQETFQYQFDYLLRFIKNKNFSVDHVIVSDDEWKRHRKPLKWESFYGDGIYSFASKSVNFHTSLKTEKKKLVICRDTFVHHGVLKEGNKKKYFEYNQWQKIIYFFKKHFKVVELEYRTPISEVMYHLATCEILFTYDGMWHKHAACLNKPRITLYDPGFYYWLSKDYFKNHTDQMTKNNILNNRKSLVSGKYLQDTGSLMVLNHTLEDFLDLDYFKFLIARAKTLAIKD